MLDDVLIKQPWVVRGSALTDDDDVIPFHAVAHVTSFPFMQAPVFDVPSTLMAMLMLLQMKNRF